MTTPESRCECNEAYIAELHRTTAEVVAACAAYLQTRRECQ